MRHAVALIAVLTASPSWGLAQVPLDRATITWAPAAGQRYELRLHHFAHPDWLALGIVDAAAGQLAYPFAAGLPPGNPGEDRWICAEARNVTDQSMPSVWVRACNQVALGTISLPTPPPAPPPPPTPTPDLESALEARVTALEQRLAELTRRLAELLQAMAATLEEP